MFYTLFAPYHTLLLTTHYVICCLLSSQAYAFLWPPWVSQYLLFGPLLGVGSFTGSSRRVIFHRGVGLTLTISSCCTIIYMHASGTARGAHASHHCSCPLGTQSLFYPSQVFFLVAIPLSNTFGYPPLRGLLGCHLPPLSSPTVCHNHLYYTRVSHTMYTSSGGTMAHMACLMCFARW
jgi:hypothetical protein